MKTISSIIITIFLLLAFLVTLHFYLLDGIDGLIWSSMFADDTVYASHYSDGAFRMVRKGMSRRDVEQLLGTAFDGSDYHGIRVERWSKSANDDSYRVRVIHFRNDRVVDKISEFYVD